MTVWRKAQANEIPLWLIGRGSNLLIPDEGLPGITIVTTSLQGIRWGDFRVTAEAGYSLARLAAEAGERGWSGLEFARGIPGTVGGAVVMNAGAHGGEISHQIIGVKTLGLDGVVKDWQRPELYFGYRECSLRETGVVLEVELLFRPGDQEKILTTMASLLTKRKESQPLDLPNAGSVFRNPAGDSAGRLIEAAGWKGKQVGGAQVSNKHANFIVNVKNATAKDILSLMKMIQIDIKEKYGVDLKPEIQYLIPRG